MPRPAEDKQFLEEQEVDDLFARLFPHGPGGHDVIAELAPDGWETSPLRALYLPSDDASRSPLPRRTVSASGEVDAGVIDPEVEVRQLVGLAVWDVFSDNHDVVAADGRVVSLGTFRGSAGYVRSWVESFIAYQVYSDTFFYMGLPNVEGFVDVAPLYRLIFRRLGVEGCRWRPNADGISQALRRARAEG